MTTTDTTDEVADLGPFNVATAARILGLGDQFIENWEADEGKDAEDRVLVVERRKEWDLYRTLFVHSPKLYHLVGAISRMKPPRGMSDNAVTMRRLIQEADAIMNAVQEEDGTTG